MGVRQTAGPRPQRIAAAFRAGGKSVVREIRSGFQSAVGPLDEAFKASAVAHFPSGYEEEFVASARTDAAIRSSGSSVRVRVTFSAVGGGGNDRDVVALNAGRLKHPVWGRTRRTRLRGFVLNPWVTQAIPPMFGDRAVDAVRPRVDAEMDAVLDRVEKTIEGGT